MSEPEPVSSPLAEALARVGDRWTLLIVDALLPGPRRFTFKIEPDTPLADLLPIAPKTHQKELAALLATTRTFTERHAEQVGC